MKRINIREALLELDRKTDCRYDLTTLYEACKLDDDDKNKLVKYIDAYDHPATINKFLTSKCDAISEGLADDDVSDMKIVDEINDGGDRTLWNLMDKFEDEDLQLKELKEDIDPEVLQSRLEDIEYAMNTYAKDSFFIDDVQGSGTDWEVTYNGTTVDVVFDTEYDEYTYTINGKGPYCHSSYEYITKDIMDFVDYGHLGQSDDEVDESLTEDTNEDVDTSNLEPQIKEVVNAFMAEVGYEADEIEAYTAVEIKDTDNNMIQVEVRAELGYDDLMELCDKLNPIVAALDHFAYFEPVTSGIARAFIRKDQSEDIVDEEAVNQWTNKIYDCASMEDLRQVYTTFKDHIDNQQYTDGTVDAVLDVIHKKADMLNESLTEDAKEEYFVGDLEGGRIYYNEKDAQAALDSLKKSGVTDAVKMKVTDMRESITEDYNKGEWVEVNLNTKKNGTPNIIPVRVEKELYHGKTFLGWAWGERQHEYPMSAIVKKIDMDDTDAIIRKYTPSGYMSEKLTLNESDDTDILYDMEDYDEDNTTVTAGNSFIEDGYTWTWFKQCGDTVHLDFDNWAVWWAYRPEVEDDENSTAISGFFVVDTDTGFIDWGPCDTVKEAQEFLQSKVNDWENDDIDESKSIKEAFKDFDTFTQHCIEFYCDSGAADNEADQYCSDNSSKWDITDPRFVDRAVEYYKQSDYYDPDDWGHLDECKSIKEGVQAADEWYLKINPEDTEGAQELKGLFIDDVIKDKGNLDKYGFSDRLKGILNKEFERYSPMITEDVDTNLKAVANRLFNSLKEYGANKITKYVDVYQIYFNNSEDDSDATLVHYDIQSEGFKEVTQHGDEPNVTEYINEDGTVCAKLLIYADAITVEVSAEDASQYIESVDKDEEGDFVRCPQCDENTFDYKQGKCTKCGHKGKSSEGRCDSIIKNFFGEAVDKDLTHCTECGKKLNDKGYCETAGCPNGTLKEGVEKYIIIAKEDGLNLYYNATDDNFGTDMKAATQYEERAVALDDYKAVKDRYPTAYIRSTYDIPLLNKPTTNESVEDENIIAKKSNGDYLIKANSGWGYTAFSAAGACIGGVTTDDEELAINKFMSGKLDEGLFGDIGKTIKAAGKEIADKTGISKVTQPVVDKAKEVAGKVKQKIDNTEAAKTFKSTETYKRIQDAKEVRGVIANIKAARSKEDIEKALAEIKALQKSGRLHTDGHMPYLMDLYKQRKRQLGLKVKKREGLEETDWSDDELASIYGGDTKYDMPDGVETPEETEARLAKEAKANEI